MKILKYLAAFIVTLLFLGAAFSTYDHLRNWHAYDVKRQIIETLNSGFHDQKPIELENIGGINWERVCFVSYELNGIDVSSGLDIPVRYMNISRSSFSQIADESYAEFKGSRYGLAFWSLEQKIFVATTLAGVVKIPYSERCHDAKNLVLQHEMTTNGRLVSFSGKNQQHKEE